MSHYTVQQAKTILVGCKAGASKARNEEDRSILRDAASLIQDLLNQLSERAE